MSEEKSLLYKILEKSIESATKQKLAEKTDHIEERKMEAENFKNKIEQDEHKLRMKEAWFLRVIILAVLASSILAIGFQMYFQSKSTPKVLSDKVIMFILGKFTFDFLGLYSIYLRYIFKEKK